MADDLSKFLFFEGTFGTIFLIGQIFSFTSNLLINFEFGLLYFRFLNFYNEFSEIYGLGDFLENFDDSEYLTFFVSEMSSGDPRDLTFLLVYTALDVKIVVSYETTGLDKVKVSFSSLFISL